MSSERDCYARPPEKDSGSLVEELRARQQALQVAIRARISALCGSHLDDAGAVRTVAAVVDYALTCLEYGEDWLESVPSTVIAEARRAAQNGVALETVVLSCVAVHSHLGELIMDVADRSGLSAGGSDMRYLHKTQEAVLEHLLTAACGEYERERARAQHSPARRRAELVNRLLDGRPVDGAEMLGYELDAWHLCAIATGANAESTVRKLAGTLGRELLLVLRGSEALAWLGGQRKPVIRDIEHALVAQGLASASLAIGEPARGVEGWRLTHREAEATLRVARHRPGRLTRYLDVALEATALQDEALGDSLIEAYLSPLDDQHGGGATRRKMLRAFFAAEHNASATAAALKVDRSTIHRWRREIEERLGCRLHERQAEIELALRLKALRQPHAAEHADSAVRD